MFRHQRPLPPIEIDEFTAGIALEAIEWHLGHLADQMRETRDAVDREGWAAARVQRFALDDLRRLIRGHLKELGPPSEMAAAEIHTRIGNNVHSLPQSAANAEALQAAREAEAKAMAARKKGRGRDREASRRMAGGRWARPRIVVSGEDLEPLGGQEKEEPAT